METYDYKQALRADIKDWILENNVIKEAIEQEWTHEQLYDWLYDELWALDCITGNGAYGYAREEECEKYISSNLSLYFEAAREFCDFPTGDTPWIREKPAQHMDTTIRCYLLGECIEDAIKEYKNDS